MSVYIRDAKSNNERATNEGDQRMWAMAATAAMGLAAGGAQNLRLVSDSVPDFSSREAFVRSALSQWPTDQEKALAQFRWVHRARRVGSPMVEDGRPVLDPVLFFNSYGVTFCSTISMMNVSLWEAAGYRGRAVSLNAHCVSEIRYGDAWHMFDSDFCNYFLDEQGVVASAEALFKGRQREAGKWYLYDHCPTASYAQGRLFMGPSSASLKDVAEDWYAKYSPRPTAQGAQAGQRYILGLRPKETYTRYWRPLGVGPAFGRPFRDGKEAGETLTLRNGRANGRWVWTPDLADSSVLFAGENVAYRDGALRAKDAGKPAAAVFRVVAANVATSAQVEVTGTAALQVSANGGLTWESVGIESRESGRGTATLTDRQIGGRVEYLLKADLNGGATLNALTVTTVTHVNQRTLPALHLGTNRIVALSDGDLETVTLTPRLSSPEYAKDCLRVTGFESVKAPRDWEPSLRTDTPAELALSADTPRDIAYVRLASTVLLYQPMSRLTLAASFDEGATWRTVGEFSRAEPYADRRVSAETRDVPKGARRVLLRWALDGGKGGLINVFAEVGFRPAGRFMPYDVTYCWNEWRDGRWIERQHTERIADVRHAYQVNVGGTRPPQMKWVRHSPAGAAKTGYADGEDVGNRFARSEYGLDYGTRLETGAAYTVSRPAGDAYPDTGGKLLTDGFVSLASFWGLGDINLTGKKNANRVGELAAWEPGGPVAVTIDLGSVQTVGGVRVCAVQPNAKVQFPDTMTAEISSDGQAFAAAGKVSWEECFFPPGDELLWEGTDSPLYDDLPAGGILDHKFAIPFEKPAQARFVRVTLAPPKDPDAGMALWEIEVYDRLSKRPWSERLRMPE
jgi:hypothetical protein